MIKKKDSADVLLNTIKKLKSTYTEKVFPSLSLDGPIEDYEYRREIVRLINEKSRIDPSCINGISFLVFTIGIWRRVKKIYRFNDKLYRVLSASDLFKFDIPFDTILSKIQNGIFIENPDHYINHLGYMYNIMKDGDEINLVITSIPYTVDRLDSYAGSFYIRIKEGETFESVVNMNIARYKNTDLSENDTNQYRDYFTKCISILMYLFCDNADIEQDADNISTFKSIDQENIKDKYREVQIFNVGCNLSSYILGLENTLNTEHAKGNDKAYIRSGHWRGSWSGTRDSIKLSYILPTIVYNSSNKSENKNKQIDDTSIICDKNIEALLAEIRMLKFQIDSNNDTINKMSRDYSALEKRYQALEESSRSDREELVSIREMMFMIKTGSYYEEDMADDITIFPWYTDKKITVFGGHPSWVNKIKDLLPNVRFVDKDSYSVNSNLIKTSDIIWLQTNAMSHPLYDNIMNVTRKYSKPVRYFKYAGTVKCATQLIEEMNK